MQWLFIVVSYMYFVNVYTDTFVVVFNFWVTVHSLTKHCCDEMKTCIQPVYALCVLKPNTVLIFKHIKAQTSAEVCVLKGLHHLI